MNPFDILLRDIVRTIPRMLFDLEHYWWFWLVAAFVLIQYRRTVAMEEKLWGRAKNNALEQSFYALVQGLLAGIFASVIMLLVGVPLEVGDVVYLSVLALVFFLVNPRFMCFAYSGAVVALSSLIFGWPDVSIPSLLALVAILHVTESALIFISGPDNVSPVHFQREQGGAVGGYLLQKFWPVPFVAIIVGRVSDPSTLLGMIQMPDWWPLVRPAAGLLEDPHTFLTMIPVVAILGYGDMAIHHMPKAKSRMTAARLGLYSVILLGLSIAASYSAPILWVAALFSAVGHEIVAHSGVKSEFNGEPALVSGTFGATVLEVLPGTAGELLGLRRGDIVVAINNAVVPDEEGLRSLLSAGPSSLEVTVRRGGRTRTLAQSFSAPVYKLGVALVPDEGSRGQVELRTGDHFGVLKRFYTWLRRAGSE